MFHHWDLRSNKEEYGTPFFPHTPYLDQQTSDSRSNSLVGGYHNNPQFDQFPRMENQCCQGWQENTHRMFKNFRIDSRIILEEIRKSGRALQLGADEMESTDENAKQKALINSNRNLYYALGLLFSEGVILTQDIKPFEPSPKSSSTSISVKAAGVALEKFVSQQYSNRCQYYEITDLIHKLRDAWDQLNN